jgi:hypothetical protein
MYPLFPGRVSITGPRLAFKSGVLFTFIFSLLSLAMGAVGLVLFLRDRNKSNSIRLKEAEQI